MTDAEAAEKRRRRRLEYLDVLLTLQDTTSKLEATGAVARAHLGYISNDSLDDIVKTLKSVIVVMQNWAG